MIERGGEIHHQSCGDYTVFNHWSLLRLVDADDGDLGVIDDRRRGDTAQSS